MVADPPVHAAESRVDRRRLHAHGLGAAGPALRNPGSAAGGAGVRGNHGPRVGLHTPCPATVLCGKPLIALSQARTTLSQCRTTAGAGIGCILWDGFDTFDRRSKGWDRDSPLS